MDTMSSPPKISLWQEICLILRRGLGVWRLVPPRRKLALGGAVGIMVFTSFASVSIPLILGGLVDGVKTGSEQGLSREALFRVAAVSLAILAGALLVREGLNVLRRWLVENTCTRIERDMTVRLVSHLMRVDLASLTHEKVGALHGRITRSVDGFLRFLRLSFLDFFPALLTGTLALVAAILQQPWVGLAMVGVIPVSITLTLWQLASQRGVRLKLMRLREDQDGTVVELLNGLDYVRAAHTHTHEVDRLGKAVERRRTKELGHHVKMSIFGCAKALTEGLFHILTLAMAVYLAVNGQISLGAILTFSLLFMNVMTPLSEIHRVIDEGHESSLRVGDLLDMLNKPEDRSFATAHHPDLSRHEPPRGVPAIEVEGLRVEYMTAEGRLRRALDDLGLTIWPGETVGVAGRSGCGKTTWLKVLMRLVHPADGAVKINGVPLESVSREAIGELIGYVGQSPFVFSGTVAENIAYGKPDATPEQVRRAAELACIHDEILAMPGEYEAKVAERGQNLSGGQRQRIALARVFLKNPPILVLDEATSALDNINERKVQEAIDAARADRTVIMVAHRLTTMSDADRIFVFDEGRIVETGTFHELLSRGGAFTELANAAGAGLLQSPAPSFEVPQGA
jgi:ATP-binding cassette subfamily B protein